MPYFASINRLSIKARGQECPQAFSQVAPEEALPTINTFETQGRHSSKSGKESEEDLHDIELHLSLLARSEPGLGFHS